MLKLLQYCNYAYVVVVVVVNFARKEFAWPVHIHPLSPFPEFLMTRALWPAYRLETGPSFIYNHFSSRASLEAPRQDPL